MAALPTPRGSSARGGRSRPPIVVGDDAPAEFFGLVPAAPIARRDLTPRAKVALTGLCILARGSRTWSRASIGELMAATGFSEKTARQGLRELVAGGAVEWDSIGDRFRILFRLRGPGEGVGPSAPAPRIVADPEPESFPFGNQMESKREPNGPATSPPHTPLKEEREIKDDERPACAGEESSSLDGSLSEGRDGAEAPVYEPDYHPTAPLDECDDQPSEDELHDAIARRIMDIWGAVNRSMMREDIRDFGEAAVEYALAVCEEMPSPPRGQGYIGGILRKQHAEGTELGRRKTRSERHSDPARWMQNYNPGPAAPPERATPAAELAAMIATARGDDRAQASLARSMLRGLVIRGDLAAADVPADLLAEAPKPVKKPAAGSHANDPPPPAAEMSDVPRAESYGTRGESSSSVSEHTAPHRARGESDPAPPPAGGRPVPCDCHVSAPSGRIGGGAAAGAARVIGASLPPLRGHPPSVNTRRQPQSEAAPDPHRRE